MQEYHAWKLDKTNLKAGPISCSMLKEFADNPYKWRFGSERQETQAMRTGQLFDLALTDPDAIERETIVSPFESFRTKEAREWKAANADKLVTTPEAIEHARKGAEVCRNHPIAGPILDGAEFQLGVVGDVGGIPAKCLLDILPHEDSDHAETLFDYKTTANGVHDEAIRKTIGQWKYHWQAGFYRTLFNKVHQSRHVENFGFIFQDIDTLEVRVVMLNQDCLVHGSRAVGTAAKEFVRCSHQGIKSNYLHTSTPLDVLPFVAMAEEEWMESLNN